MEVQMRNFVKTAGVGITAVSIGFAAFAMTTASAATHNPHDSTTTTTLAPPQQGNGSHAVTLHVDTVQGAGGTPAAAAGCSQSNLFQSGQVVVFRMTGNETQSGGQPLTNKNVTRAYVVIPGVGNLYFTYSTHGTVSLWTVPFNTKGYPLGVVNFKVSVTTKKIFKNQLYPGSPQYPGMTGTFTQQGYAPPSVLTIVPDATTTTTTVA
jgi:hypothetical protein